MDFGRVLEPKLAPFWDHVGYKTSSKATSDTKLKKAFKKRLRGTAKDGEGWRRQRGGGSLGSKLPKQKTIKQRLERLTETRKARRVKRHSIQLALWRI